jgi:hypothetical protein
MSARTNFDVIADLLKRGDRFSLKRAETLLTTYLDYFLRIPYSWTDMAHTFTYLARIEWIRGNYEKSLHYFKNAEVLFYCEHRPEIRSGLAIAEVLVKLGCYQEAQDKVIQCNAAASALDQVFRDEVMRTSNHIFQLIQKQKRLS